MGINFEALNLAVLELAALEVSAKEPVPQALIVVSNSVCTSQPDGEETPSPLLNFYAFTVEGEGENSYVVRAVSVLSDADQA